MNWSCTCKHTNMLFEIPNDKETHIFCNAKRLSRIDSTRYDHVIRVYKTAICNIFTTTNLGILISEFHIFILNSNCKHILPLLSFITSRTNIFQKCQKHFKKVTGQNCRKKPVKNCETCQTCETCETCEKLFLIR